MEKLSPIPIPPAQRWRQFRTQILPGLVLLSTLGGIIYMWQQFVHPPTLVGQVAATRARVTSPAMGSVIDFQVSRFDQVQQGQLLARIQTTDPRLVQANLELAKADVKLTKLQMREDLRRNELDSTQLRLDWMSHKGDLASARANLEQARNELERLRSLHTNDIVSASVLDQAEARAEALEGQVDELEALVRSIKAELEQTAIPEGSTGSLMPSHLEAALEVEAKQLQQIREEMKPIEVTAPIGGTVSEIFCRAGENVVEGGLILEIQAQEAERITGYLKSPMPIEPTTNMAVTVRTRSGKRQQGQAEILHIGNQMQTVTNLHLLRGNRPEIGLPIVVNTPPGMSLRPGEVVDLIIHGN